jgi:hypothetical protein
LMWWELKFNNFKPNKPLEELLVHALSQAIAYEGNLYATDHLALITFFITFWFEAMMVVVCC